MIHNVIKSEPGQGAPVVIEQVFAEKPGGGRLANQTFDVKQGTAVYQVTGSNLFAPIKAFVLVAAVTSEDTTIKIAKGSGVEAGDIITAGKKGVACSAVDHSEEGYDTVTVTIGAAVAKGTVLYQGKTASASSAVPVGTPIYVTGDDVPANSGDYPVRLINGANLRKETAPIAAEVAALIPTINLV